MIPLEQEIDFLNSYLRLEQMRFPDKFDFGISCCEGDDAAVIFLPPMLVQPFAENAIRHGFVNLRRKGHLSVEFKKEGKDLLKCTITDNGIGREKARLKNETAQKNDRPHSGTITETRIRLFNSPDSPNQYKIVYTDLFDNGKPRGLKVELYLPMEAGGG
jgi:sensor histidine kinase YesM